MAHVLIAALVALLIAILAGPFFIDFLRRHSLGQNIREEGPQHHSVKQGTPTMGGILIVLAAGVAFLATTVGTLSALTIFGTMVACGAIGFVDDYMKVRHKRSLGLSGRVKMLLLLAISAVVCYAAHHQQLHHSVFVPIVQWTIPLSWWGYYILIFLIIAGSANAVNLTDGIDGLAAGAAIISLFTLTAMAVIIYIRNAPGGVRIANRLDVAYIGAALIGAAVGFLWFNAFPAEVFMGDTGSMALGGAIGAMAIFLQVPLLLLLVGGIFVIEALSVVIQVISFRRFGKRVFLMAPIHHHFEMKSWSETKIMVRFWIVTGILCTGGFALFYKYYPQIRP